MLRKESKTRLDEKHHDGEHRKTGHTSLYLAKASCTPGTSIIKSYREEHIGMLDQ